MPQPKKPVEEKSVEEVAETVEETVAEEVSPEVEAPTSKSKKTSVTVQFYGGTREYSKEVHGADFENLAKEFAKKFNGTII